MMMNEILSLFIKRPYVIVFLVAFLFIAIRKWGVLKTLMWLAVCYFVALSSEIISTKTGFPYGWYKYIPYDLKGELKIFGIPFFDTISYAFLIFCGYSFAEKAFGNKIHALIFGGALFTMLLNMIINPVTTMGDQWFLGKFYQFKYIGYYFGVPFSNFFGWYLTSAIAIGLNLLINRRPFPNTGFLPTLLFSAIAIYNIMIAEFIGHWELATAGTLILLFALRIAHSKTDLKTFLS